ncbi:MAG: DUF3422 domain-containing protein [Paracoccaceae bacterium]|nr:DUF3422 domain-containing protein [Paracoccaceae bacterium]
MPPIEDHPQRYRLANELHARPFPAMSVPCTVTYIAIETARNAADRNGDAARNHLTALLDRHGAPHPQPGAIHYTGRMGRHRLKWERHTEFVTFMAFVNGVRERPFDPADFEVFPNEWLAQTPGRRITSATIRLVPRPERNVIEKAFADWFVPESLAVSSVLDGAAEIAGDFRIDPAGHLRFAVFADPETGRERIGRLVQRLCEIETYTSMSMQGLAKAREVAEVIDGLDSRLMQLMSDVNEGARPVEETLPQLLGIATELETIAAQSAFRFGATGAYEAIVKNRIAMLRENRCAGRQTFGEFMTRRYEPAMRTVTSVDRRLATMADRAMRAGQLLRTRVDVERSAQNQQLLESMNRRADLQLRLQRTVEGLSVVAISYYAVSLASYLLAPIAEPAGMSKGILSAVITLPIVAVVWFFVRRIRRKFA